MTRLLLERTAVAGGRLSSVDAASQQSFSGQSPLGTTSGAGAAAATDDIGGQLAGAIEAAEKLENAWLILMANPVVRDAYHRYHGIYSRGEPGPGERGGSGTGTAHAAPRCDERVSDLLVTLRELDRLGPAQWKCLARDYSAPAVEPPPRPDERSLLRPLRRVLALLTRKV